MPAAVAYIAGNVATWVSGAIYNGLTAIGVSAGTAAAASTYAATLAAGAVYATAYLAPALLAPRPGPPSLESAKEPINQTRPPRRYMAGGSQRLGGPRLLFASIRDYGLDVVAHCEGPIVSYPQTWLHDDEVTPDGSTGIVAALSDGSYGKEKVSIHGKLGLPGQTAIGELTAIAGTLWTATARATGVAISAAIFRKTKGDELLKIYRLGRPKLSRRCVGAFYDWRKDSTAGGSGAHRRDNPATWEASRNPVVCFVHNEVFRFGQSWERRFAPVLAELTTEADYCDALVPTAAGGTEPRYQIDGSYTADADRSAVRRWYLECMDGSFWRRSDGAIIVRAGRYIAPDFSLPPRHIIQIAWKTGVQKARRVNQLTGAFVSPAHAWTEQQADPWRDEDAITAAGLVSDVFDRPFVASHDQWRRLAKRAFLRRQVGAAGTITTNLWGLNWAGQRWITLPPVPGAPPSLAAGVELEVLGVRKAWPLRVIFDVALSTGVSLDDFNPATEGGTAPGVAAPPPLLGTPVPAITLATAETVGGQSVLRATIDPAYVLGLAGNRFDLRWRALDAGNGPDDNWSAAVSVTAPDDATTLTLSSLSVPSGVIYEVSARAVSAGVPSDWSGPVEVDAPPPSIVSLDFLASQYRVGIASANLITSLAEWSLTSAAGFAFRADGTLTSFSANAPRITDRGLLLEAARTNLVLRSTDISNASWTKTDATITADAGTAPDGTMTADKMAAAATNNVHRIYQVMTVASGAPHAPSFFVKPAGLTRVELMESSAGGAVFDLVGSGSVVSGTGIITALPSGWYRIVAPRTSASTSWVMQLLMHSGGGSVFTGNGTDGVMVWGGQLETGSVATSPIATTTAPVTRPADAAALAIPSGLSTDVIAVVWDTGSASFTRADLGSSLSLNLASDGGVGWLGHYIETVLVQPV